MSSKAPPGQNSINIYEMLKNLVHNYKLLEKSFQMDTGSDR